MKDRRADFVSKAIAALEELDTKPRKADAKALALKAFEKLQYDFPLLTTEELGALAEGFRASLSLKSGWLSFCPTTKFVENIVRGALPPAAPAPSPAAAAAAAANAQAQDSSTHPVTTTSTISGRGSGGGASSSQGPEAGLLRSGSTPESVMAAAYRQLCLVVLIQFVNAVLGVPEQEAWRLLASYDPQEGQEEEEEEEEGQAAGVTPGGAASGLEQVLAMVNGAGAEGPAGAVGLGQQQQLVPDVEAEELDDDDFAYEPLEDTPAPAAAATSSGKQAGAAAGLGLGAGAGAGAAGMPGPLGLEDSSPSGQPSQLWPEIKRRLLHLTSPHHLVALASAGAGPAQAGGAGQGQDAATPSPATATAAQAAQKAAGSISSADLWSDPATFDSLLQLVRTLGVHDHAAELQPLLDAFMGLLADRLASQPAEVETTLGPLLEALGVHSIATMPRTAASKKAKDGPAPQHALPREASTALSLVANLAAPQAKASSSGRVALWRQVNTHMLPLLDRCLSDIHAWGEPVTPESLAAALLVCQVVAFYMEARPGGVDAAKQLLSAGVVRGLSLLLPRYAGFPAAEPLRAAATLCMACSDEARKWMLAVPGVAPALCGPAFCAGGCAEAHGALLRMLEPQKLQPSANSSSASNGGAAAAGAAGGQATSLADLIRQGVDGSEPGSVVAMHAALQLMSRVWQACNRTLSWGPATTKALQEAARQLKDQAGGQSGGASGGGAGRSSEGGSAATGAGAAEAQPAEAASSSGAMPGGEQAEAGSGSHGEAEEELELKLHGHVSLPIEDRRAQQLRPLCLKLIKELMTTGGKTD